MSQEDFEDIVEHATQNRNKGKRFEFIFGDKDYFDPVVLKEILTIRENIEDIQEKHLRQVLLTALLSIMVDVSKLKRAPDLKYKPNMGQLNFISAADEFRQKASALYEDMLELSDVRPGKASNFLISATRLAETATSSADLIITSPPYLNGTNYIKNTKLELWICGALKNEDQMKKLNQSCISCSINTAQKLSFEWTEWSEINNNIKAVEKKAYDTRITPMVANYFHDMHRSIQEMYRVLRRGSKVFLVIGDSAFNNVHIPTHLHLMKIAKSVGFRKDESTKIRDRRSRGGMSLSEDLLIFQK